MPAGITTANRRSRIHQGTVTVVAVTATPLMATAPADMAEDGIVVQSLSTNTGSVFVGGVGLTTDGVELVPGGAMTWPMVTDPRNIYVYSVAGGQVVNFVW